MRRKYPFFRPFNDRMIERMTAYGLAMGAAERGLREAR